MASQTRPMYLVEVTLKGLSPLMTDCMKEQVIWEQLVLGIRPAKQTDLTQEQIAEKKLYTDDAGAIGIPSTNLFACLREAGRYVKVDAKKSVSTASSTVLPAVLSINEMFMPLTDGSGNPAQWKPDVRRGMLDNAGKKVAVGLVRPMFKEWQIKCTLEVDSEELELEKVRKLLQIAGSKIGLCSFRPECNGQFGRFEMVGWEAVAMK